MKAKLLLVCGLLFALGLHRCQIGLATQNRTVGDKQIENRTSRYPSESCECGPNRLGDAWRYSASGRTRSRTRGNRAVVVPLIKRRYEGGR
jgi:hypothetical protein